MGPIGRKGAWVGYGGASQLPGEPLKETPFEGSTKDYQFNVAREFIANAMKDDRK